MTNKKKTLAKTTAYEKNRNQQHTYKKAIAASQITTIYEDHSYPTISRMTPDAPVMTDDDTRKYKRKTTATAPKTKQNRTAENL